jgi:hypothetical protein
VTRNRESAANASHSAVKSQLAREDPSFNSSGVELTSRNENTQCDRKVERCSVLPAIGGRKVYRYSTRRKLEPGVDQRSAYAHPALLDRANGQANHGPLRKARRSVDLDEHIVRLDSHDCRRSHRCEHPGIICAAIREPDIIRRPDEPNFDFTAYNKSANRLSLIAPTFKNQDRNEKSTHMGVARIDARRNTL